VFGGLGLGELFVARNAGNLADTATIGTLEYGAAVLGSPLIVVLSHSRCGAVSGGLQRRLEGRHVSGIDWAHDRSHNSDSPGGSKQRR
jgi:carbonic anhydrase